MINWMEDPGESELGCPACGGHGCYGYSADTRCKTCNGLGYAEPRKEKRYRRHWNMRNRSTLPPTGCPTAGDERV